MRGINPSAWPSQNSRGLPFTPANVSPPFTLKPAAGNSGIGLLAWATRLSAFRADSLGPARPEFSSWVKAGDIQFLGPPGTVQSAAAHEVHIVTPESNSYVWNEWDMPMITERIKKSARWLRESFEGMDAREKRSQTDLDAKRE